MADSDIPPLEDMTEVLQQAQKLRELKLVRSNGSDTGRTYVSANSPIQSGAQPSMQKSSDLVFTSAVNTTSTKTQSPADSSSKPDSSQTTTHSTNTAQKDFGGMKKGFLFGSSKPKSASKTAAKATHTNGASSQEQTDSIPFVKPKSENKESSLKFSEVQEAMDSASGFLKDKDWVTDDLLQKVTSNKLLAQRLNDPRFMQAINEFQTNPQAAMAKYQNNPEVQLFLKEFCGVLGEHFTVLGDKEDGPKVQPPAQTGPKITEITDKEDQRATPVSQVPVDPKVQEILSDQANREILMDPQVQKLIHYLRSDPGKAERMLRESDSSLRQKIDRLVSLGLLQFQAS